MMSGRWNTCVCALGTSLLLALSSTAPAVAQNQHDMTFHTVPPCTVVDTRSGGGAFAANETRTYNVVGSGSFASQGGSSTGCGIPGFSSSIAQVQAVELTVTSVNTVSAGHIVINAADESLLGAVLNTSSSLALTNTSAVAVAQASGVGDIKVFAGVSGTDIILRVVGYYSKPVQTVYVHPVPGNSTASGTALINAVGAITTASSTKRFVVKVEPGIYDVGTAGLTMKSYVDIEGSGEEATVIQGPGAAASTTAVLYGAASAELRNLQVKSTASSTDSVAVPILLVSADTRISHVTVNASGPSTSTLWGIRLVGSTSVINDTTINLSGGIVGQGITSKSFAAPKIHNTHITVTGYTSTGYGILATSSGAVAEMDGLHVEVSGGTTAYGYFQDSTGSGAIEITGSKLFVAGTSGIARGVYYIGTNARISRSTVRSSGGTSYGIDNSSTTMTNVDNSEIAGATATVREFGIASIGGSKLDGGAVSGSVTCAGVWDESYAFYASTCP